MNDMKNVEYLVGVAKTTGKNIHFPMLVLESKKALKAVHSTSKEMMS